MASTTPIALPREELPLPKPLRDFLGIGGRVAIDPDGHLDCHFNAASIVGAQSEAVLGTVRCYLAFEAVDRPHLRGIVKRLGRLQNRWHVLDLNSVASHAACPLANRPCLTPAIGKVHDPRSAAT